MTSRFDTQETVPAAGALVWRRRGDELEVLLVHRPRYDDWSWPKGKLDPGETYAEAAVREVFEETGLVVRLGVPLPTLAYALTSGGTKVVHYWAAQVLGGSGALEHEIDDIRWLPVARARRKLSYERDRLPLDALATADAAGELDTWPLLLIRHAHAVPRSQFDGDDDALRPLSERGRIRATAMVPMIGAWAPEHLVSSSSTRCVDTLAPYAQASASTIRTKRSLSEETFAVEPERALRHVTKTLDRATPATVCTHGPLIPSIAEYLSTHAGKGSDAAHCLERIAANGMDKGEIVACHILGSGAKARITFAERLRTPATQR